MIYINKFSFHLTSRLNPFNREGFDKAHTKGCKEIIVEYYRRCKTITMVINICLWTVTASAHPKKDLVAEHHAITEHFDDRPGISTMEYDEELLLLLRTAQFLRISPWLPVSTSS